MSQIRRRTRFTQAPEDLLYAGRSHTSVNGTTTGSPHLAEISDAAFRLYCVLDRHADQEQSCYPSVERLAALLGKGLSTIRGLSAELAEAGWIEKVPQFREDGGQTSNLVWLNNTPNPQQGSRGNPQQNPGGNPQQEPGGKREPEEREPEGTTPLDAFEPDESSGSDGAASQLFKSEGIPYRKERQRQTNGSAADMITAAFEPWWSDYPSGKQRGPRAKALTAWRKAIKQGTTTVALEVRLSNYIDARNRYHTTRGTWPALMHGATFLNGRHEEFTDLWSDEDLAYWDRPGEPVVTSMASIEDRIRLRAELMERETIATRERAKNTKPIEPGVDPTVEGFRAFRDAVRAKTAAAGG